MKFRRSSIILFAALSLAAAVSCKKDDDDESNGKSLNGSLVFEIPTYVKIGDVIHIVPSGVYRGDDESDNMLSYSWTNPLTSKVDTIRLETDPDSKGKDFDFVVSGPLKSYTVTIRVWAEGYTAKSASSTFTVVDPEPETGSLSGYGDLSSKGVFTDGRDGNKYYFTTAGGLDWMMQNLAYSGAGVPYQNADAMSRVFGRYYDWAEAGSACPEGWRLPTDAEFVQLAKAGGGDAAAVSPGKVDGACGAMMADIYFNGSRMWEFWPDVKITNATGFSAIPAGYALTDDGVYNFKESGSYALFWTASGKDDVTAYARYIYVDNPTLNCSALDKEGVAASVRCVR